jgi:hypothetical protein
MLLHYFHKRKIAAFKRQVEKYEKKEGALSELEKINKELIRLR